MASDHWRLLRKPYEFTRSTKIDALRRDGWSCTECGKHKRDTESGFLEIHHIVPIWFAVNCLPGISTHVFKSLENAQCLCKDCHKEKHNTETKNDYAFHAQALLAVADLDARV